MIIRPAKIDFTRVLTLLRSAYTVGTQHTVGFCLRCGADAYGVNLDAEREKCRMCGDHWMCGVRTIVQHSK